MIEIHIPGRGTFELEHVVFDVNGTLALDGILLEGVVERLTALQAHLTLHMLTADTHGRQEVIDTILGFQAQRIGTAAGKVRYVLDLGAEHVVAVGNGANDVGMLRAAALGIAVLGPEGAAADALQAADIVAPNIIVALELLLNPRRIVATLRR
ncbi:MAG: HAD hydrolase family protein [Chloroflexi bacterium]|nr:HAD hydrolase family protein [Chloroflexota bacterium]